jgi:hypothetical protein
VKASAGPNTTYCVFAPDAGILLTTRKPYVISSGIPM